VTARVTAGDAILLDIEGTTTPVRFVYEVLFPFARRHLGAYLDARQGSGELSEIVALLGGEWAEDAARGQVPPPWTAGADPDPHAIVPYVLWLMDRDRKSPGLKRLQGLIWERGYRSGALTSELFPDVAPALRRWRSQNVPVAIYSSGSVLAQRLLFSHTAAGDLTPCLAAFFDTSVGAKTSPDSYRRIAGALERPPGRLLFVSDATKELDAAHEAGCRVLRCVRPGHTDPPGSFASIRSLDEIAIE
jgi:enolase-phosphatase E1